MKVSTEFKTLYLYQLPAGGVMAWASSPDDWRKKTGLKGNPMRFSHKEIEAPSGYHKPNGCLACHAIEPVIVDRHDLDWEDQCRDACGL